MRARRTASAALFVTLLLAASGLVQAAPPQDLAGHWEGAIELPGTKLAVNIDFAKHADGAWKGDISIPLQGAKDLPLAGIKVEGRTSLRHLRRSRATRPSRAS